MKKKGNSGVLSPNKADRKGTTNLVPHKGDRTEKKKIRLIRGFKNRAEEGEISDDTSRRGDEEKRIT